MKTIKDLIKARNVIQIAAENQGRGDEAWSLLGVANRHFVRVLNGELPLTLGVEKEIEQCLSRANKVLNG
jgi:hypothetical protein